MPWPLPVKSFSSNVHVIPDLGFFACTSSPAIKQLAQRAHETLWDNLPLHAILSAHKGRAKELADADEDGQHSAEVYVAYYKFLQLRMRNPGPTKDTPGPDPEYVHLYCNNFFSNSADVDGI